MQLSNARRADRRQKRSELSLLKIPFKQPRNLWQPFEMLSPEQIEQIHDASMWLLEEVGIAMLDAETCDLWDKAGAKVDHKAQQVWIERGLLMELIAKAPASFTLKARNPAHDLLIGENVITFYPNAGMVYCHDLERGRIPGTMQDFEKLLKLVQMTPVLHHGGTMHLEPQDVPVNHRHLQRLRSIFNLTDKAAGDAAHGRIISADGMAMAKLVFGDPLPYASMLSVINCSSPMRYDSRMLGGAITYARENQVIVVTPFILAGAMSPITMASAIAQQNAEALAGIATLQLARAGAPCIYGGFTSNIDMRSGSPAFGTPEGAWALSVGAQLARRYHLPYRGSGSLNTAKLVDAQAAYETMWTLWPAVMANTNFIIHAVGWMDGGLTVSFEKFILDAEMLAMFQHFLAGFEINEETLAKEMIRQVGPGGHHFGTAHTQARYQTEFYPSFVVGDRKSWENWEAAGSQDAVQRAHTIWKEMLTHYEAPPLDPAIGDALTDYVNRRQRQLVGGSLYDTL